MPFDLIKEEEVRTKKVHKKEDTDSKNIKLEPDNLKDLFKKVIEFFMKQNPNPRSELNYKNGYELIVATILSAQSTDKRVNMVTPELFKKFPSPNELAKSNPDEIFNYISSITYPGNKSEYLFNMANSLIKKYNGNIPENVEELQSLSGVGRKTAHIIASTLFNKPVLAVDTHVFRVAERIGLTTNAKNPLDSEEQLVKHIPKDIIPKFNYWLVLHGRYICTAKNPNHEICGLKDICRYYNTIVKAK